MKTFLCPPLLCDLRGELDGRFFHALCIGAKRDVLVLSTPHKYQSGVFYSENKGYRIHHWHNGAVQEVELPTMTQIIHFVAACGDDYLCVAARCSPEELNAHLFNSEGEHLRSWHAGDGIEDVQVTPNGQIWVSYFDEGVYNGMGNKTSGQGLVCFDAQGQRVFGFYDDAVMVLGSQVGSILDCYALNVTSNRDTWVCYYQGFSLVHLRDHKVKEVFQPSPGMVGTYIVAVRGTHRLFMGGHQYKGQIFWRDEATGQQVPIEVTDEEGDPFIWNHVHARGADLFLCNDALVRMLSLNDIELSR